MIFFWMVMLGIPMLVYCLFLVHNWLVFLRMDEVKPADKQLLSVSVIIPARNEEKQIDACLDAILKEDYPDGMFEVIVADDHSEDGTAEIVKRRIESGWKHLKLIALPDGMAGKKAALAAAIKAAENDIILTTDADCISGPSRITAMMAAFSPETAMVSGPVRLAPQRTLFEKFQALEFIGLILVGAGSIGRKKPTMCNGANLAYRKSAWMKVHGFGGIDHIASGDDELLMHKMHEAGMEIRFCKSAEAAVTTAPAAKVGEFLRQRKRWTSKTRHYRRFDITFFQAAAWLAAWSVPLSAFAGIIDRRFLIFACILLLMKILAEALILNAGTKFLKQAGLMKYLIPEQFLHIPYIIWAGFAGMSRKYKWKGRETR